MLEYIFFSEKFRDLFIEFVVKRQLDYVCANDPIDADTLVVRLEEPEDEALWDDLDDHYDCLNKQDQEDLEQSSDGLSGAGIYLELSDGSKTLATVNPDVMNRMLAVVSMDEFNEFVEIITRSVEAPDNSPICQQLDRAKSAMQSKSGQD